jgi:plastocyanin
VPSPPGAPAPDSTIVTAAGAQNYGYATPVMVVKKGATLNYANLDPVTHNVVSAEKAPDGTPLFQSGFANLGQTVPVVGMDRVQSGVTYHFYCSLHPGMQGQLIVQ